jgi:hypothetical protein
MPLLLTHVRPHVDDVCGLWLLERFDPAFAGATRAFVPSSEAAEWLAAHPDAVAVGTGRGRYDEHKGDLGETAATLVYKDVRAKVADDLTRRALDRLIEWVRKLDTGLFVADPQGDFSLAAALRGSYEVGGQDSEAVIALGYRALDGLLVVQRQMVQLEDDWSGHIEFDSPYGRAAAFVSSAEGAESYAYRRGFDLAVTVNREGTYSNVRAAATTAADLSPVAEALKSADPGAEWFVHHSKKMLICGGYLAPHARTSALSLAQLVDVVRKS